nr:MAG TPA_asm: hypothetical protein [Caudoviricetes sp.]
MSKSVEISFIIRNPLHLLLPLRYYLFYLVQNILA